MLLITPPSFLSVMKGGVCNCEISLAILIYIDFILEPVQWSWSPIRPSYGKTNMSNPRLKIRTGSWSYSKSCPCWLHSMRWDEQSSASLRIFARCCIRWGLVGKCLKALLPSISSSRCLAWSLRRAPRGKKKSAGRCHSSLFTPATCSVSGNYSISFAVPRFPVFGVR